DRSRRQAADRGRGDGALGQPHPRHRPRERRRLQALRPRHRGRARLDGRDPAAVRRRAAGGLWALAADVRQRLAGSDPQQRLRRLVRRRPGAHRRPDAGRTRPGVRRHGRRLLRAGGLMQISGRDVLPEDWTNAVLVGRMWFGGGPIPVVVRNGDLHDLSELAPTLSHLFELPDPAAQVRAFRNVRRNALEFALLAGSVLAPCDLQAIKAAGVTFADSLIERVIEERAKGDPAAAVALRAELTTALGGQLDQLKPGSPQAM